MATMAFDVEYYLAKYQDVREAVAAGKITAEQHWNLYGCKEERNPNAAFNTAYYAAHNADVVASGMNYLDHYIKYGSAEAVAGKRLPNSSWESIDLTKFDKAAYLSSNPDVKASGMDALQHYMLYGQFEASRNGTAKLTDGTVITAPSPAGDTYALTPGADVAVGALIDGSLNFSTGQTLNTLNNADTITGTAGTVDKLFVQLNGTVAAQTVTPASVAKIEVLELDNSFDSAGAAFTVNLANGDTSLTTITSGNNNTAGATVAVNNVKSAPTAINLANTTQGFTLTSSGLTGTTNSTTLSLSSVTGAAPVSLGSVAAGSGYETINVQSNGSVANSITLTDGLGNSLTSVGVTGAQALTLALLDTTVTTVNATDMTGALTLTVAAANAQNMTITGGAGNDVINMNGTYTSADVINGGTGTDRLTLTNAEAIAATTVQAGVSNIDVIGLSDGLNGTVTISNFGATGLRFGANMGGAGIVNFATGTNSLDLQNFASAGNALAVNVAGVATTDVLNMTMGSTAAGNTFGAGNVTMTGVETVNLLSQGGANTFGGTFTLTNTAATESIVLSGSQNMTFTGAVRADVIDASGMTGSGALTLTGGTGTTATTITGTGNNDLLAGSTAGDIIQGGAGNDSIRNVLTGTATSAHDVLTGGAGYDDFVLRGVAASAAVGTVYNQTSTITDFTLGTTAATSDHLYLSNTAADYGVASLYAGIAIAAPGGTALQTLAQNATVAVGAGTDLIKLSTGVDTTGMNAQLAFDAAIGTGTVTGFVAGNEMFVSYYDTANSKAVILVVDTGAASTVIEATDVVTVIGTIDMTSADYATFNANQLGIMA